MVACCVPLHAGYMAKPVDSCSGGSARDTGRRAYARGCTFARLWCCGVVISPIFICRAGGLPVIRRSLGARARSTRLTTARTQTLPASLVSATNFSLPCPVPVFGRFSRRRLCRQNRLRDKYCASRNLFPVRLLQRCSDGLEGRGQLTRGCALQLLTCGRRPKLMIPQPARLA